MKAVLSITFLFCCFLLLLDSSISLPLCLHSSLCIFSSFAITFWVLQTQFHYRCICVTLFLFGVGRPFNLNTKLGFCPYNGSTCCNSTEAIPTDECIWSWLCLDCEINTLWGKVLVFPNHVVCRGLKKKGNSVFFLVSLP